MSNFTRAILFFIKTFDFTPAIFNFHKKIICNKNPTYASSNILCLDVQTFHSRVGLGIP